MKRALEWTNNSISSHNFMGAKKKRKEKRYEPIRKRKENHQKVQEFSSCAGAGSLDYICPFLDRASASCEETQKAFGLVKISSENLFCTVEEREEHVHEAKAIRRDTVSVRLNISTQTFLRAYTYRTHEEGIKDPFVCQNTYLWTWGRSQAKKRIHRIVFTGIEKCLIVLEHRSII